MAHTLPQPQKLHDLDHRGRSQGARGETQGDGDVK
jgi:hypothetical protein